MAFTVCAVCVTNGQALNSGNGDTFRTPAFNGTGAGPVTRSQGASTPSTPALNTISDAGVSIVAQTGTAPAASGTPAQGGGRTAVVPGATSTGVTAAGTTPTSPGAAQPNGFIINADGSVTPVTPVGQSQGAAVGGVGGTNAGAGFSGTNAGVGLIATNSGAGAGLSGTNIMIPTGNNPFSPTNGFAPPR